MRRARIPRREQSVVLSAFSPLSLSPSLWFDFSDLTTLFQDTGATSPVTTSGQSIARINDLSGNARHATQATPAAQPTYSTVSTIGGRATGSFDGGDRLGTGAVDLTGTNQVELWGVVQSSSAVNDQHFWGNRNASAGSIVLTHSSATNPPYIFAQGNVGNSNIFGAINSAASVRRGIGNFALSTNEVDLYVDGVLTSGTRAFNSNNTGFFGNLSWWIGARSDGAAPFTGKIGELFAFNRLLTTTEAANLSTYLRSKWGTP